MCTAFASSSTTPTPATARSAWCTASTSRCRGASRTTSPSRASTATSRCTPRCSGPTACRSRCRSAPREMHRVAESGIAAHWKYKSGGDAAARPSRSARASGSRTWCRCRRRGNSEEFLESVKVDLFPDKVYVFTPKGKILRLPTRRDRGRFRLCDAHRHRQPLRRRQGRPAPRRRCAPCCATGRPWRSSPPRAPPRTPRGSTFVVTAKARSAIRHYLRTCSAARRWSSAGGCSRRRSRNSRFSPKKIAAAVSAAALSELNLKDADELYEKIGLGERLGAARGPASAAGAAQRRQPAALGPARDRRHRRAAGHLRALLLPDPARSHLGLPLRRARRRDPPRELRQRRGLPQAAGEMAAGELAGDARAAVQLARSARDHQSHGVLAAVAAAIAGTETNIDHVSIESSAMRHARCSISSSRSRPQASGARHPHDPPHAGCAARGAHHRRHARGAHARAPTRRRGRSDRGSAERMSTVQQEEHYAVRQAIHTERARRPSAPTRRRCGPATPSTSRARFRSIRPPVQLVQRRHRGADRAACSRT